jgi:hypothetical protein
MKLGLRIISTFSIQRSSQRCLDKCNVERRSSFLIADFAGIHPRIKAIGRREEKITTDSRLVIVSYYLIELGSRTVCANVFSRVASPSGHFRSCALTNHWHQFFHIWIGRSMRYSSDLAICLNHLLAHILFNVCLKGKQNFQRSIYHVFTLCTHSTLVYLTKASCNNSSKSKTASFCHQSLWCDDCMNQWRDPLPYYA